MAKSNDVNTALMMLGFFLFCFFMPGQSENISWT
nr:hypothetical protein [Sinobaca sp. H24]